MHSGPNPPLGCGTFPSIIDSEPDNSVHPSKRPRTSTGEYLSLTSGHFPETQCLGGNSFFDSAWEDLISAESTLRTSVSPDVIQLGCDEVASYEPVPEKERVGSFDLPPEHAAARVRLDLTADVDPASDWDSIFSNQSSLYDEICMAANPTPPNNTLFDLNHHNSFPIDHYRLPSSQRLSPSNPSPIPQPNGRYTSNLPPVANASRNEPLSTIPEPSQLPLDRLQLLTCRKCSQGFADRIQLK